MQPDFLGKIGEGYEPWPDPLSIPIVGGKYQTPDGSFPRVTSILKVLGLGAEALQNWAGEVQREATIAAATEVWLRGVDGGPLDFIAAVEQQLGVELEHQKQKEAAGDLGTAVHDKVRWWHQGQLGVRAEEPSLPEVGELAFTAYRSWWEQSGLTAVRVEQPIWNKDYEYGGTIDNVAMNPDGRLGIVDLKTSKNLYDKYHLQCTAYLMAGRRWAPLEWAVLVRLPKHLDDRKPVEVRPLGKLYNRTLTEEQLIASFKATVGLHHLLVEKKSK